MNVVFQIGELYEYSYASFDDYNKIIRFIGLAVTPTVLMKVATNDYMFKSLPFWYYERPELWTKL